jgi:hypothetical protein
MSGAIIAVLTLLEQFIPLLGTSSATVTMVDGIINALTALLPYIISEVSTVYTAVKNIISLLQNSGAMSADQMTALQTLDAQVDAGWAAVQAQIDPDNPANAGTLAGDPA